MGRKIPGKKHRGIKDPIKQLQLQKEKLKNVINQPPSNPNVQEIPQSVLEIQRLRDLVKSGKFNNKKKKRKNKSTGIIQESLQNERKWPSIKQKSDETDQYYLYRVDKESNEIINEVAMKVKHDLDDDVEVNKGKSKDGKKITTLHTGSDKQKKKVKSSYILDKTERSKLRRKLVLEQKKVNKIKTKEDFDEIKKDYVKFGEVALQPPQLTRRPRGCNVLEKPGCKDLLLNSMFANTGKSSSQIKQIVSEREKVMEAYKAMKIKNRSLENK